MRIRLAIGLWAVAAAVFGQDGTIRQQMETVLSRFVDSRVQADSLVLDLDIPVNLPQARLSEPRVDWTRPDEALRGHVTFPVRVQREGRGEATVYVGARIRTFDWMCVAGHDLERHDEIGPAEVVLSLRESTKFKGDFFRRSSMLEGWRVSRRVAAQREITSDMVEPLPLVRQGDTVEIRLVRGNLVVSTQGVARQDGWEGDLIRVRMAHDNKEMKGRVAGPRVVAMSQ